MSIPDVETECVGDVYNKIASAFSDSRLKPWDWIISFLSSLPSGSSILDIGCGNGRNMVQIGSDHILKFKGIDSCSKFVEIANKRGKDVIIGDMCKIPIESEQYDAIISIASLHHLSTNERRIQCLNEMMRMVKPGGKLLLSVWSIKQPKHSKNYNKFQHGDNMIDWKNKKGDVVGERYYYIFKIRELTDLLLDTGFHIIKWDWIYGNEVIILEKPIANNSIVNNTIVNNTINEVNSTNKIWCMIINSIIISNARCNISTTKEIILNVKEDLESMNNSDNAVSPNLFIKTKIEQMLLLYNILSYMDDTNDNSTYHIKNEITNLCNECLTYLNNKKKLTHMLQAV